MTKHDEGADDRKGSEERQGGARNWVALIFVLLLAVAAVFIVNEIIKQVNIQNCILSGRRNCVDIVPSGGAADQPATR